MVLVGANDEDADKFDVEIWSEGKKPKQGPRFPRCKWQS